MRNTLKNPVHAYGAINHADGRRIEITSKHLEWVDYASTALYAHDAFMKLLAACEAMPFAQRPHAEINAVKEILK
jgi:hypothetical protein